ncbi:MAG: glycosyltransferase [Acidimicrobiia bacterium]
MTIGLYHPRTLAGDGGITRSVRSLSSAMTEAGFDNRVIFDGAGQADDMKTWVGIPHFETGPLSFPMGLSEVMTELRILVLHSAWVSYNVVAARIAASHGVPYVLAPRGGYEPRILQRRLATKKAWWHLFERRLVQRAAAIHVFFESQADQIRQLGFDGPLIVAPNGVRVPGDISWDGGSSGALVYVGRFDPEAKGLDVLLEAMSLLPRGDRPQVLLCGPDWRGGKAEVAQAVDRLSLRPWVEMRPPIYGRAKFELMASAKGFLYPSMFEAFGNSAAEAASLGVPVLTGTYPLGEYLAERDAAIAASVRPECLAEGLVRLSDPEAAVLGANGREAMKPFSWTSVGKSWGSQLMDLLAVNV